MMTMEDVDAVLHTRYKRGGVILWEELPDVLRLTPEKYMQWYVEHPQTMLLEMEAFFARLADARYCHAAVPWGWPGYWSRCSQRAYLEVSDRRTSEGRRMRYVQPGQRIGLCARHGAPVDQRPELDPDVLADIWAEIDPSILDPV